MTGTGGVPSGTRGVVGIACPHCGGKTKTRSSRAVTPTYRQLWIACLDPTCGATFGGETAITHAISPSARPNSRVQLRQVTPRTGNEPTDAKSPANDDHPPPDNDNGDPPKEAAIDTS